MMKPFSHQAELLQRAWNDPLSKPVIIEQMINTADDVFEYELKHSLMLNTGKDLYDPTYNHDWSEYAFDQLFSDGFFTPFQVAETVRSKAYLDYIVEHANADDEEMLAACYWIATLSATAPMKYMPLIRMIMSTTVNGI